MKKLLTAMALAGAVMVASAEDNFLYWMVDVGDSTDYAFNYATIKAQDESGNSAYLLLYGQDSANEIGQRLYASNYGENGSYDPGTTTGGGAFAGLGDYYGAGSKFLFELWTDGGAEGSPNRVGWTGWIDYSKLADSIFAAGKMTGSSPFTVGPTLLVPEPTGGLLTLLGLAVLALRRKQKVA